MNPSMVNLGLGRVRAVPLADALETMRDGMTAGGRARMACFCEASLLSGAIRDPGVAQVLESSDWVFADGVAVERLARMNGTPFPERMPGPTFLLRTCAYGVPYGWRHFFLGGQPGVAEKLAATLGVRFPGLIVAGIECPPFRELSDEEDRALACRIENSGAQILWVALGSPRQERWVLARRDKIRVQWIFPVGAAFDFHVGTQRWAPAWIRKIGMEWLFRTVTGGRRIFLRNLRCVTTVALYLARTWVKNKTARHTEKGAGL